MEAIANAYQSSEEDNDDDLCATNTETVESHRKLTTLAPNVDISTVCRFYF